MPTWAGSKLDRIGGPRPCRWVETPGVGLESLGVKGFRLLALNAACRFSSGIQADASSVP